MSSDLIQVSPDELANRKTLDTLHTLSVDLQDKAVKSSLRVSAKPLMMAMKRNAPDDSATAGSRLERAINIRAVQTGKQVATGAGVRNVSLKQGDFGVVVGPNKRVGGMKVGKLAMLLEGGAKAHKIAPRKKSVLRLGQRIVQGSVNHPGIKARHWMTGAFDSSRSTIESQFYIGLNKWIQKNGR